MTIILCSYIRSKGQQRFGSLPEPHVHFAMLPWISVVHVIGRSNAITWCDQTTRLQNRVHLYGYTEGYTQLMQSVARVTIHITNPRTVSLLWSRIWRRTSARTFSWPMYNVWTVGDHVFSKNTNFCSLFHTASLFCILRSFIVSQPALDFSSR